MIANPTAGRSVRAKVQQAAAILREAAWPVELHWTQQRGSALQLARQAVEAQAEAAIAVGGDGTVNEVLNGLIGSTLHLGVIPLGTANCFAHESGIPVNPAKAARMLLESRPRRIHLGKAGETYFLLMASVGFDAEVVDRLSSTLKQRLGKLAYILTALRLFFQYRPPRLRLVVDGQEQLEGYGVVIGNTRYYGGRFQITPQAGYDKEELDVCLFQSPGVRALMRYAWGILNGSRHLKYKDVVYRKTKRVSVESLSSAAPVQIDGDPLGRTPMQFEMVPNALSVLLPQRADS